MDDGVYGSFSIVLTDHYKFVPQLFKETQDSEPKLATHIFGPTCCGYDQICKDAETAIPRVEVGDWLYWDEMGAYCDTTIASFRFNGYTYTPAKFYVNSIKS